MRKRNNHVRPKILSIDLLNRLNISDQSETYRKDIQNVSHEVGIVDSNSIARNSASSSKKKKINTEIQMNTTTVCQKYDMTNIRDMLMQHEHENPQQKYK